MGKSIGLKQLAQKVYREVTGLPHFLRVTIGDIEDAFDCIVYGHSGNGKSNFTVAMLKGLIQALDCKAEYIAYEEGHGKSIQMTMDRHNMLTEVGNRLVITEHLGYEELVKRMSRKQSAKIWVIDSLQAAAFTYPQCQALKEKFVMSRKKKILIFISWCDGKEPQGSCAKAVKYYANVKLRVQDLIVFPVSRYGGNHPYIIYEPDAKRKWGLKAFNKIKNSIPPEPKKSTDETDPTGTALPAAVTVAAGQADSETNCETDKPII